MQLQVYWRKSGNTQRNLPKRTNDFVQLSDQLIFKQKALKKWEEVH